MNEEEKQIVQELVNTLSRSRQFTNMATRDSHLADKVLWETDHILNKAYHIGFPVIENKTEKDIGWNGHLH